MTMDFQVRPIRRCCGDQARRRHPLRIRRAAAGRVHRGPRHAGRPRMPPRIAAPSSAPSVRTGARNARGDVRPQGACRPPIRTRGTDMLGRIIEWSARNVFLVLLATLFVVGAGIYAVLHTPLDAMPDLSDVQVIIYTEYPGQAPQVVEDQVTYPLTTAMLARAQVQGGARLLVLRRLVRLRHLRGRHRHLLGALAGAGIPQLRLRAPAARRHADAGAGRDRRRLGVPVRRARREAHAGGTAHHPGLVRALPAHQGAGRGRSGERRRLRPAVPGDRRSAQAAGLRHSADESGAGDPRQQPRRRRPRGRNGGDRIHGARPRLSARQ